MASKTKALKVKRARAHAPNLVNRDRWTKQVTANLEALKALEAEEKKAE